MIDSITLQPVRLRLFKAPKACIFKLFKHLASFSYVTWSSATFLASNSEPWTCGNFNTLIVPISLQPVRLAFFNAPSKIVPSLHRLMACIFHLFKPVASFSHATSFSAKLLASYSELWTWENLIQWYIVSIMLQPLRLGFFTAPSTIVPSLHRQKACIFKLFKPLASLSYVT